MKPQEKIKQREDKMQQIFDRLNYGVLKDCIYLSDSSIWIKTYHILVVRGHGNEEFLFDNYGAGDCMEEYLGIEKKSVFKYDGDGLTFEEIMDSIIVPDGFSIGKFKQELVNKYDWCRLGCMDEVEFTEEVKKNPKIHAKFNIITRLSNEVHTRWNNGLIELDKSFKLTSETAQECEEMFELIDEALNHKWDLYTAMKEISEEFEWLSLKNGAVGYVDKKGNSKTVISGDGDVNYRYWHNEILTGHPTFKFDSYAGRNIELNEYNFEEFKDVLREYETKILNAEFSWEK